VPEEIRRQAAQHRHPLPGLPQTQDEFYFEMSYRSADLILYAMNNGLPAAEPAACLGLAHRPTSRAPLSRLCPQASPRAGARALVEAYVMEPAGFRPRPAKTAMTAASSPPVVRRRRPSRTEARAAAPALCR